VSSTSCGVMSILIPRLQNGSVKAAVCAHAKAAGWDIPTVPIRW
jgi:hypothetical protein